MLRTQAVPNNLHRLDTLAQKKSRAACCSRTVPELRPKSYMFNGMSTRFRQSSSDIGRRGLAVRQP